MKKFVLLIILSLTSLVTINAQDVSIDGRLQPYLNDFFEVCKQYNIEYHEKLFKLEKIDIVNDLQISEEAFALGMVRRNENNEIKTIAINWVAQLDKEILKVVAFHEFAHYFLEYSEHVCDDCGKIMSVVNTSYFDIIRDWDNKVKELFVESPAYIKKNAVASVENKKEMITIKPTLYE